MGSAKSQVVSGSEVVLEMQSPKERKETAISSRRLFDSSTVIRNKFMVGVMA